MTADTRRAVLVVEDDEATAELERRALQRSGMEATIARSVASAREQLQQVRYSAVLLDYHLPDGEPWEVLEAARQLSPRVPVVLITAMGNENVVAEALRRGAADYVRKTGSLGSELATVVTRVIRLAQEEDRLRQGGSLFQLIADSEQDLIVTFESDGVIRYVSPACRTLLGYEAAELIGHPLQDFVHPSDLAGSYFARRAEERSAATARDLFRCRRRDGEYCWLESNLRTVTDSQSGKAVEVIGISRDVTERVIAQRSLESAVHEKSILLREVQHRVRNNLQVIISLMTLQMSRTLQKDALIALENLQGRVRTISLAHQLLYEQNDFSRLDLNEYLSGLSKLVSTESTNGRVRIVFRPFHGEIRIPFEVAIPAGLAVNELLHNAVLHAFPGERQGVVEVAAHREPDNRLAIRVTDNGVGMPDGFDHRKTGTLGFQLIGSLIDQVHGELQQVQRDGTGFEIQFTLE